MGRGGSDTTAVALAAALGADRCEIYTDVDGIYSADPQIVPRARKLSEIGYEEMLELASYGAKMHPRSIELGVGLSGTDLRGFQLWRCSRHANSQRAGRESNE